MANPLLTAVIDTFRQQKLFAERAMVQVGDEQLHAALDARSNSIAVVVKHMAGNMKSRWTDFLTSDGEKPWRQRDDEFIDTLQSHDELMATWNDGWQCVFDALESLNDADLTRTVTIRGEQHSVMRAICRQLDHYGYHVGQIVNIAKALAGETWQTLTIPRGESEQYNQRVWKKDTR